MGMDFPWIYPVRGVQWVFGIIVLGLAGHIASVWNDYGGSIDEVNFMVFNGVWTCFIVIPYLVVVPMFFPVLAHKYAIVAVEAVTTIFWLSGFASTAARLPSAELCKLAGWCKEGQAATVFGAFQFILWGITTGYNALVAFRSGSSNPPEQQPPTAAVP